MVEDSFFIFWLSWILGVAFVFLIATFLVKTVGKGVPLWGLAGCIVLLFLFLPIIALALVQEALPSLLLSWYGANSEAPSINVLAGSISKLATLDQVYFMLAIIFILFAIGQCCFSAWLLYVRHNRESLFRAIRLMWTSGLMVILAMEVFPLMILNKQGMWTALHSAPYMAFYFGILILITAYLRLCPLVNRFYPSSHRPGKTKFES